MPLSRPTLERQLELAKAQLAVRVGALVAANKQAEQYRLDPKWRTLNADVRQVQSRLRSLATTEANDADVARRKSERETAAE